jgi:ATP-dependent Lhr-like helicase
LFDVFRDYDPENLLFKQAYEELLIDQFEFNRFRDALLRFESSKWVVTHPSRPTPLAFPIVVDRLREKLTSERLNERVKKMTLMQ